MATLTTPSERSEMLDITTSMQEILLYLDNCPNGFSGQNAAFKAMGRRWPEDFDNQCRKLEVRGHIERHFYGRACFLELRCIN